MIRIVFWNLGKNVATLPHLACLAAGHGVDALFLAECPKDLSPALALLGPGWREAENDGAKVRVLSRFDPADLGFLRMSYGGHLVVWSLKRGKPGAGSEWLLGGVHLPAKTGGLTDATQVLLAADLHALLQDEEDSRGHRNSVMFGDFNMNPWDEGMASVAGFQALMTRHLARLPDRMHRGRLCRRMYGPMWGLVGDRTPGPPGTYRWDSSLPHNTHWHLLDQVLLRPSLMDRLGEVRILDSDGTHPLLDRSGYPDAEAFSDHLPILFSLDD